VEISKKDPLYKSYYLSCTKLIALLVERHLLLYVI